MKAQYPAVPEIAPHQPQMPSKFHYLARRRLADDIAREISHNVGGDELEELAIALHAADESARTARMLRSKLALSAIERFKQS